MNEIWLPVPGWEGYYSVSDHGRVRSESRTIMRRNGRTISVRQRILKPATTKTGGYHTVVLAKNGQVQTFKIHTLVLLAFIGPRPDGLLGLHRDDNPVHNMLSNLYYGTHSDNRRDSVANNTHAMSTKTSCKSGHKFTAENTYLYRGTRLCKACRNHWQQSRRNRKIERTTAA